MTQYQEKRKLYKVNQVNMTEEEIIITEHLKTIQKNKTDPTDMIDKQIAVTVVNNTYMKIIR